MHHPNSRAIRFCLAVLAAAAVHALGLRLEIRKRSEGFPGTVSLYGKNLDSGAIIGIREREPVRSPNPFSKWSRRPLASAPVDAQFAHRRLRTAVTIRYRLVRPRGAAADGR